MSACLVLAVGMGYHRWRLAEEVAPIMYATTTGEQRTVALDDGSRVVLDTGSDLTVQYGRRDRRLTLLRGRADFWVQQASEWQFVVIVSDDRVNDNGTRSRDRTEDEAGAVARLEGRGRERGRAAAAGG